MNSPDEIPTQKRTVSMPLSFKLNLSAGVLFFAGAFVAMLGGRLLVLFTDVPAILLMVAYHIQRRREKA